MAATNFTTTVRTARADAITTTIGNAGILTLYDGVRPAGGGAATHALVNFTLGTPPAAGAVSGVWTLTHPASAVGVYQGTATWARITTSAGVYVMDMDVTDLAGAGPLKMSNPIVHVGQYVSIASLVITDGNA
jgi:hypothetical protein